MHSTRWIAACAALAAGLLLVACGGGGAVAPEAPGAVPAGAWASARAFTQFAAGLAANERGDPLTMPADAVAPTSETDDPLPVV